MSNSLEGDEVAANVNTSAPLHLSAEWLSDVLQSTGVTRSRVSDVSVEPLGVAGALGEIVRVRLVYAEEAGGGPRTMIAKLRGGGDAQVALDEALGVFRREGRFYAELAPRVPVRVPGCFHPGDGVSAPLLLEDLAALRMGDQIVGLTSDEAARLIDGLADLHLAHWETDLDLDWLATPGEGVYTQVVSGMVAAGAPAVRATFEGEVDEQVLAAFEAIVPRWAQVLEHCVEGPQTIVHNDCRLDNVFFDGDTPVLIDWQLVARSRGTHDVANLLAGSMDSGQLRDSWEPLLRRYHARLLDGGVSGYSWSDCREHYRRSTLYPLGAGIPLLGSLAIDDDRNLGRIIVGRTLAHAADLDAFSTV